MFEIILDWLAENSPVILLCIVIAAAVWTISKFYYGRFCKTEDAVAGLPCGRHEDMFADIRQTLNELKEYLISKHPRDLDRLSGKASPRMLNENGRKIFSCINGREFIDKNSDTLFRWIDERKPKTAYDVEILAYTVLMGHADDDMFNDIKIWVYNSPTMKLGGEDYTASFDDACFVISIQLRDDYLNTHDEIIR